MGTQVKSIDGKPGATSLSGARAAKQRPLSGSSKGGKSKGKSSKGKKSGY